MEKSTPSSTRYASEHTLPSTDNMLRRSAVSRPTGAA